MQLNRIDRDSDLPDDLRINHDIREGLKKVHAPGTLGVRTVTTIHRAPPQEQVIPEKLHQAFRYGINIGNEVEVAGDLQRILAWLKENLG
jgi:hypothetical protein